MHKDNLISKTIARAWAHYRDWVKSSRRKANFRNIHALRVATERLEAIIVICRALFKSNHGKKLIQSFKETRKKLGPLRDLQVESEVSESEVKNSELKKFSKFISKKKRRAEGFSLRYLSAIPLKKEKRLIKQILSKKLILAEQSQTAKNMKILLEPIMQYAVRKFYGA